MGDDWLEAILPDWNAVCGISSFDTSTVLAIAEAVNQSHLIIDVGMRDCATMRESKVYLERACSGVVQLSSIWLPFSSLSFYMLNRCSCSSLHDGLQTTYHDLAVLDLLLASSSRSVR